MQSLLALLGFALTVATLLYMGQGPDPPARLAELLSGLPSRDDSRCDVANLELLRRAAIVYTWVNGTESCYNKRRERAGLPHGGTSRDKEMGELKYSLRSLLKFAPWLEGPIYIVTPGQIPDWLDMSNPRVRVVDQDDLLPKDKATIPTYNTNIIEQYLHKIPGLTDIFIHMNDDYLFIKPVAPDRLFTCDGGIRMLTEINHIRHVPSQKSNAWLASVRNTVQLTDKTYGGQHVYNFLKHAPFVYSRLAFEEIHKKFSKELDAMLPHQTRHTDDLNMPLLHHIYMQEEGSKKLGIPVELNPLSECNDWLLVRVKDKSEDSLNKQFKLALENQGPEILLALNDEYSSPKTAELVGRFYAQLLPDPTIFELPEGQHLSIVSNWHGPNCLFDPDVIPLPEPNHDASRWAPSPAVVHFRSHSERAFAEMMPSFGWILASNIGFVLGLSVAVIISVYIFRFTTKRTLGLHMSKQT
ncbi:RxLR-like protein [Plasmopara halstedii]|uniref:RxLR-like protein n=1 Tax=Plasmopara halstedii TaxID=4781 RepID=A0A0P1A3V3_PLAHL|nr:RxLR-like protein [Plasmopara halstedii]CEG35164.1 RxLR-like protein [Plasmopara halstedii]|eukprot:XP_024571533.1 RxLR-like protein [Plasmopara halstedii]